MRRLNKFLALPSADRRLIVNSLWLVGTVRLGLWLLPFDRLRRLLANSSNVAAQRNVVDPNLVSRIAWAVSVSSHYIPRGTCLTQALAAKFLLDRYGQPASLRIGVARGDRGTLLAHAWVESNGEIVIGGDASMLKRFTSLPLVSEEIM